MLPFRTLVGLGTSGPSSPAPPPPPLSSDLFPNGVVLLLLVSAPPAGDELPPPCGGGVPSFFPLSLASTMLLSPPKAASRIGTAVVIPLAEARNGGHSNAF